MFPTFKEGKVSRSRLLSLIGTGSALGVLSLALACTTEKPPAESPADTAQIATDTVERTNVPRPVIDPAQDSITLPFETNAVIPDLGSLRLRYARDCDSCRVLVWIGAYPNSRPPDAANPPESPIKVARVINLGRHRTWMYGLDGRTQYDLVYRKNDVTKKGEFAFEPLRRIDGRVKATGDVTMCPGHAAAPRADADFKACDQITALGRPASILGPSPSSLLRFLNTGSARQGRGENPAWWACGTGCCTAAPVSPI